MQVQANRKQVKVDLQANHKQLNLKLKMKPNHKQLNLKLKMKPNIRIEIHTFLIADQLYYHSIIEGPIWIQIQLFLTKPNLEPILGPNVLNP